MSSADAVVASWIVRRYRAEGADSHLRECPDLQISDVEATNGQYGCDTGCDYARLEADMSCPHGHAAEFYYGEFGELAQLLESVIEDEEMATAAVNQEAGEA